MKITWLGQAGLMMETGGRIILIDPYLSDSVAKINPLNYRRVSVDEHFLHIKPDVIICTHNHLDHADPETLKYYLTGEGSVMVLAPTAAWEKVREFGGKHNYLCFNRHTEITVSTKAEKYEMTSCAKHGEIRFVAIRAEHSAPHSIGVIIEAERKRYYVTGDTLYNTEIFEDVPEKIDMLFLPINGVGNNMNMADAKRFCERIRPGVAVPMHCGLFDEIDMNAFGYEPKIVPQIYREITF